MKNTDDLKQKNSCTGRCQAIRFDGVMSHPAAAALFLSVLFVLAVPAESAAAQKPSVLKSVVYTGNEWTDNFWSTEMEGLDEDMACIAADGFNSIILVVPWCEFQPDLNPAAYNLYAFDRLDEVMDAAEVQNLWVQLRVSYTWDYTSYGECKKRFRSLLSDPDTENAWVSYVELIYETASEHENFYGGFIACEDFLYGLDDSVRTNRDLQNAVGAELTGYEDSYDVFLNRILNRGQEVFPGLSMELLLDEDTVSDETEKTDYVDHVSIFSCGNAVYTCALYRVPVGNAQDTELTADEALDTMAGRLSWLKNRNEGKPVYIDRLIYMNNDDSDAAEFPESARAAYLAGLAPILKKYTNGYGLPCYRNHVNNSLYNSQFALEDSGWETSRVQIAERDGSMAARLEPMGRLSQKCGARIGDKKERDNYVRFTADSDRVATLTVALGTKRKNIRIDGRGDHILNFGRLDYDQIAFTADGDVYLDNVQVYNFVQDGQLYDQNGRELSCITAVRELNAKLK